MGVGLCVRVPWSECGCERMYVEAFVGVGGLGGEGSVCTNVLES